jgi:hypothetical protein
MAPSLTRGWVCNLFVHLLLGLASAATVGSKSRRTRDHNLPCNLKLGSLSVTSYDSHGYSRSDHNECQSQTYLMNDGQSASLSWYQATICEPRPISLSLLGGLPSDICWFFSMDALSYERMGLQFTRTIVTAPCQRYPFRVQVPQNMRPYLPVSSGAGFLSVAFCDSQSYRGSDPN